MSSTKQKLRLAAAFAALGTLALAVSCQGFFPKSTVASFVISPTSPTVPIDGTTQMYAYGTDSNGNPVGNITGQVNWSSAEPGIVSVTPAGVLSGLALSTSTVTITASYQALAAQTATATVCVETTISGTFEIVPATGTQISTSTGLPNGITASVQATVNGTTETLDITPGVQWSSSSADMSITGGTSPATVLFTQVTTDTPVTVTATYTCNTTTITQSVNYTLTP